jgi:hypothetical protein
MSDFHYLNPYLKEKLQNLNEDGKLLGREDTFTAQIYVGCYDTESDFERPVMEIREVCQNFVEDEGLCVNVRDTFYQYGSDGEGGNENGAIVELIHYPRFPKSQPQETITVQALDLAEILMNRLNQKRVSVVTTEDTYTLQNPGHSEV